ncbi:hypothetical protein GCM10028806_41040 [Spirosoma terrae]|uniref:DUF3883 domain-containing protein n=1 Tax=Spirosoma terrae TaxID=1968276 RepID=A0A6L9LBM4_9BACT|nr:DUF3883 domain-containing protein [Spirosoma terrae]NDU94229.1 DUF3883 domain-containing protein [Spirosoma terrae]
MEFFEKEDIIKLSERAGEAYNASNKEHKSFNERYVSYLHEQTKYWGHKVAQCLIGYIPKTSNYLAFNGVARFPSYTWARIVSREADKLGVYFTVGVDTGQKALIYKLDYERTENTRGNKRRLTIDQQRMCEAYLSANHVPWQYIYIDQLDGLGWDKLIQRTVDFINKYSADYTNLLNTIWNIREPVRGGELIQEEPPKPVKAKPKHLLSTSNKAPDYDSLNRTLKAIGNAGEKLVLEFELKRLISEGREDLAKFVRQQPDGEGYDILSFTKDGTEKYIEVKTTVSNDKNQPFPISSREVEFVLSHQKSAFIYRLYKLSLSEKTAKFFILTGEEFSSKDLLPITFRVLI